MANEGSYAAYRQLTPLGSGISDDIKYWNEDGYKRRQEKRIDDAIEQKRKDDKKKEDDALYAKVAKHLKNYDTGSKSLNEIQGRLLQEAMQEYIPIMEVLSNENTTNEERLKAEIKLSELHNLPENMALVTKNVTDRHNAYLEGIKSGKIFRDEDYEKKFQNGYEAFALSLDDNGLPVLAYRDIDGDGINDIESYEEIKTGIGKFDFQKRYDTDSLAVSAASQIGKEDITEANGAYRSTQEKQIKLDEVAEYARNTMQDENGQLTDVAKSELRIRGLEATPENVNLITKDFEELIISKSDYLKKENVDASALTSRLNSQDKNKTKPTTGEAVTPTKGNWGNWYGSINKNKNLSVPVDGVKVESIRTTDGGNVSNYNINNYTYDKDGHLILDGFVQSEKTITIEDFTRQKEEAEKNNDQIALTMLSFGELKGDRVVVPGEQKKKQVRVNKEDESNVAMQLGLSIEEMRSKATIPEDQRTEETQSPKLTDKSSVL